MLCFQNFKLLPERKAWIQRTTRGRAHVYRYPTTQNQLPTFGREDNHPSKGRRKCGVTDTHWDRRHTWPRAPAAACVGNRDETRRNRARQRGRARAVGNGWNVSCGQQRLVLKTSCVSLSFKRHGPRIRSCPQPIF